MQNLHHLIVPSGDAVDGGVLLQEPHSLREEAEEVRGHVEVLLED